MGIRAFGDPFTRSPNIYDILFHHLPWCNEPMKKQYMCSFYISKITTAVSAWKTPASLSLHSIFECKLSETYAGNAIPGD